MSKLLYFPLIEACYPVSVDNVWKMPKFKDEKSKYIAGELAEVLLLADRLFFYISSSNLELVILEKWFGYNRLLELIENEIIKFVHVPGVVTYLNSGQIANLKSKLKLRSEPGPVFLIGKETPTYSSWLDPYQSAEYALRDQTKLSTDKIKKLAKMCENSATLINSEELRPLLEDMMELDIKDRHDKGYFHTYLSKEQLKDLPSECHTDYINIFNDKLHVLISAKLNIPLIKTKRDNFVSFENLFSFNYGNNIISGFKSILKIENIIDIPTMFINDNITFDKIFEMRNKKNSIEFRKWIKSIDKEEDTIEIVKMYNSVLPKSLKDKIHYKFSRLFITIGTGMINPILGAISEIGLSSVEHFIIDKIKLGWSPKFFVDEIRKNLKNKKNV